MANQELQKSNQLQTTSTHSEGAIEIGVVLKDINKLVAFHMDGPMLMSWADDLDRLLTDEGKAMLPFLMDQFKMGKLFYDKSEGIQNIFNSLRLIRRKADGGFEIKSPIW